MACGRDLATGRLSQHPIVLWRNLTQPLDPSIRCNWQKKLPEGALTQAAVRHVCSPTGVVPKWARPSGITGTVNVICRASTRKHED